MSNYDLIVIGAGPGGYVCAIRAAQNGLKVGVVEGRETLGGTCLNVGCIPSKALLHASHMLHEAEHNFAQMGLKGKSPSVDWAQMQAYKQSTIDSNTSGIQFLFKKNKIDWIKGWGQIASPTQVLVGDTAYETKNIVIATGSVASALPQIEIDEEIILSSTGALSLKKIPKKMAVIGAGVIGLELGSVYARLGTEVTVIEYLDHIAPNLDRELSKQFQKILMKQGVNFILDAAVESAKKSKSGAKLTYKSNANGEGATLDVDVVLMATGRRAFTEGLGFGEIGGGLTDRGMIETDHNWRTNIPGIYAIGDVIKGPMLAHKAEDEGIAVADMISGKTGHVNYDVIPSVIYTTPEVASVGLTEEECKSRGIEYNIGKFPFLGNARAKAAHQGEGFVKILSEAKTDRILGCHLIGPSAGDLIHEVCVAMEFGASAEDLALTCHAHPTFSEAIREAALACGAGAIHA